MPVEIRVHKKFRVNRARLKRVAARALRAEATQCNISIYIATDREIRTLNKKFHATDAATDVLSFPARVHRGVPAACPYLGDIIISYDRARAQAHEANWDVADELDLLVVHGVLHLVGYDDLTPRKRQRMWKRQAEILGKEIERQRESP